MKNNRNFLAISRCSPFPVLEKDCMDYSEMHAYKIDDPVVCTETQAIIINHNVVGDNLVSQLLTSKRACFGCIVASPWTCFRQLQLAEPQGKTCQKQKISWKSEDVINSVFFQPVVIFCKGDGNFILLADHGVDDLWLGRKVIFEKGTFIARYNIFKSPSDSQSFFSFENDRDMDEGTLRITLDEQMDDYKVIVKVADKLYQALSRHRIKPEHRISIMSQALTGALAKLALEENEETGFWKKSSNLTTMYNFLQDKDISTWDHEDFDPALAALKFHPHKITEEIEE